MTETQTIGLIIPRHSDSELLLDSNGKYYFLPSVVIPQRTRAAQQITSQVRERWKFNSFCRGNDRLCELGGEVQYQILEPSDNRWTPTDALRWMPREALNCENCLSQELAIINRALHTTVEQGPFARADWFNNLLDWMKSHLQSVGHVLTGQFEQLNSSEFFNLVRFETTQGAVWFKAVGNPNLHEYAITLGLVKAYSEFLPRLIAKRPEWNGWITEEYGTSLYNHPQLESWRNVAMTLARLQIQSVGKTDELLVIGCKDVRLEQIAQQLDPLFDVIAELMALQPKVPPQKLTSSELKVLKNSLRVACLRLQDQKIPDSILHGDFSPGSILVKGKQCVFTDWAEGYVGHPFVTFEHMLVHLQSSYPELQTWQHDLRASYARCWDSVIPVENIDEALRLIPAVAALIYAVTRISGRSGDRLRSLEFSKKVRSLARRMHREISALESSGTLCLN
jgi:hypothetical protein